MKLISAAHLLCLLLLDCEAPTLNDNNQQYIHLHSSQISSDLSGLAVGTLRPCTTYKSGPDLIVLPSSIRQWITNLLSITGEDGNCPLNSLLWLWTSPEVCGWRCLMVLDWSKTVTHLYSHCCEFIKRTGRKQSLYKLSLYSICHCLGIR